MAEKVKLNRVRLAFANDLYEAAQFKGKGDYRHTAQLIVETGSDNDKALQAAIKTVAEETWKDKADAVLKSIKNNANKSCYVDGDTKAQYDGFAGNMSLSVVRKKKDGAPKLLDNEKNPVTEGQVGAPYAGCYVGAVVQLWAQDNEWGKGIRCQLGGLIFMADGDAFGGGQFVADDDFDDLSEGADAPDLGDLE